MSSTTRGLLYSCNRAAFIGVSFSNVRGEIRGHRGWSRLGNQYELLVDKLLDAVLGELAAVFGALDPAERQLWRSGRVRIDPHGPGLDARSQLLGALDVG